MTFGDMWGDVVHLLGLSTRAANDETAYAKRYVNDGVIDILSRCRPTNQCIHLHLSAGKGVYTLDQMVMAVRDIVWPDVGFLSRLSRQDVQQAQQDGSPYGFAYLEPMLWISPIPSVDMFVEAYGTVRPTAMSAPTDDPATAQFGGLAREFHGAIVNYALWKSADQIQHGASSFGERWRLLYEGQDGLSGDVARIKRIAEKRATPQGARRRDLTGTLGPLSDSGSYITTGG